MSNIITDLKPEIIKFSPITPRINNKKEIEFLTRTNFARFLRMTSSARQIKNLDVEPFEEAVRSYLQIPEVKLGETEKETIKKGDSELKVQINPSKRKPYQKKAIEEFLKHLRFKVQESLDEKRPWNIITYNTFKFLDSVELVEKITSFATEKYQRPRLTIFPQIIHVYNHKLEGTPNNIVEEENIRRYFSAQLALIAYKTCSQGFEMALKNASDKAIQETLIKNPNQKYFKVIYTSWGGQKVVHPVIIRSNPWRAVYENLFIKPGFEREFNENYSEVPDSKLGLFLLMDKLARISDYNEPKFYAALTHTKIPRETVLDLNPMIKKKRLRINETEPRKRLLLSANGIEKIIDDEVRKQEKATKKPHYMNLRLV